MTIDFKVAPWVVMSRVAVPLIVPDEAVTVVVPTPMPVARPPVVMEATLVFAELHCTELVILLELPSLNFPAAVNC
jgi:hypothetical protein